MENISECLLTNKSLKNKAQRLYHFEPYFNLEIYIKLKIEQRKNP